LTFTVYLDYNENSFRKERTTKNMDDKDILMMQLLHDDPGMSLQELTGALQCSITTAYNRVSKLTEKGLIQETPKGVPRRRNLTPSGVSYLEQRHLIWHDPRRSEQNEGEP